MSLSANVSGCRWKSSHLSPWQRRGPLHTREQAIPFPGFPPHAIAFPQEWLLHPMPLREKCCSLLHQPHLHLAVAGPHMEFTLEIFISVCWQRGQVILCKLSAKWNKLWANGVMHPPPTQIAPCPSLLISKILTLRCAQSVMHGKLCHRGQILAARLLCMRTDARQTPWPEVFLFLVGWGRWISVMLPIPIYL